MLYVILIATIIFILTVELMNLLLSKHYVVFSIGVIVQIFLIYLASKIVIKSYDNDVKF
jgi:hypothetical protein